MALPRLPFATVIPSRQLISGQHINNVNNLLTSFGQVVALAGGGLTGLTPVIDDAFTEITVVASAADSVSLPLARVGLRCMVTNSGANSAQIMGRFGSTDVIQNAAGTTVAANVGVALAAANTAWFICSKNGIWRRVATG